MDTQQQNSIAVIIPVWNGMRDLPGCLTALSKQQDAAFDIIAVDNASTDDSVRYISEQWPDVHLIRNDADLGFSRACNIGLEAAQNHSIFVLLNQDTEAFPDWLARLIAPMQHDAGIGIAGSKAIYPDGTIEHAGGRVDKQGVGHHIGRGEPDRGQFGFLREVDFVTGAALALTRQAYQAVGGFDEQFSPAYYEDVDLCYRVRHAGFRVVYVPNSALVHKASSTLLDGGHDAEFMLHRNRLRFVLKHWSVHRLVDDFMPAEQRWLDSLGWQGEQIIAAMHHAYLYQLVRLSDIVEAARGALSRRARGDGRAGCGATGPARRLPAATGQFGQPGRAASVLDRRPAAACTRDRGITRQISPAIPTRLTLGAVVADHASADAAHQSAAACRSAGRIHPREQPRNR